MIATKSQEFHEFLSQFKSREMVPLVCPQCMTVFSRPKNYIQSKFGTSNNRKSLFCSQDCKNKSIIRVIQIECEQCGLLFHKQQHQFSRTKHHFCSRQCSGIWHMVHKTHGLRRSKIEISIEYYVRQTHPELQLMCNHMLPVNAELDFYFPDIKLAFEMNGVFHYEPIYGIDKLTSTQAADKRKQEYCRENGIEFIVMDISSVKRWSLDQINTFTLLFADLLSHAMERRKQDAWRL